MRVDTKSRERSVMGLLDWLGDLFKGGGIREARWVHVRCQECGEALKTRVDLSHDLSVQYDSKGRVEGYFTRKSLIGSGPCFNQVDVKIEFNARRRPVEHIVHGGELITEEQYEALEGERSG